MARGATNQKGPERAFLNALEAIRAVRGKMPVNLIVRGGGRRGAGLSALSGDRRQVPIANAHGLGGVFPVQWPGCERRRGNVSGREGHRVLRAGGARRPRRRSRHGRDSRLLQGDHRFPGLAAGAGAGHADLEGRQHHHRPRVLRQDPAALHGGAAAAQRTPPGLDGARTGTPSRHGSRAVDRRHGGAGDAVGVSLQHHAQHRRDVVRLHRSGNEDDPSPYCDRQTGLQTGARIRRPTRPCG